MRTNQYNYAIADIYDLWYRTDEYDFTGWLFAKLEPEIHSAAIMTDLACGTGTLAVGVAKLGLTVYGLDASCAMLERARKKARREKVTVHWMEGRMEQFYLPEPQDLIVCAFDSLNHLLSTEAMRHCFRCVQRALKPGGCFVFDVNNLNSFQALWNHEEEQTLEGKRVHMHNHFDLRTRHGRCTLTITSPQGTAQVQVIDERYFPPSEIQSELESAGLSVERCEPVDPFPDLQLGAIKDLWYCKRS